MNQAMTKSLPEKVHRNQTKSSATARNLGVSSYIVIVLPLEVFVLLNAIVSSKTNSNINMFILKLFQIYINMYYQSS